MSDDLPRLVCQATEHDWQALYGGMRFNPKIAEQCSRCRQIRTWKPFINTKQVRRADGITPPSGAWEYDERL